MKTIRKKRGVIFLFLITCGICLTGFRNHAIAFRPLPDIVRAAFPDTPFYETGDTIAIYASGLDTTYITEPIPDSVLEEMWVINNPNPKIIIELTHQDAEVNEGVIGINLTDFFEPGHGNEDDNDNYDEAPDPWEAVYALAPKTIRIFSGAGSKFMHPLGYYDEGTTFTSGGYGFHWKEMVPFYDQTQAPFDDAPIFDDIEEEFSDIDPEHCGTCGDWMDGRFIGDFEEFYHKWEKQESEITPYDATGLDLEEQELYINQFIDMVGRIEDHNTGLTVDVIVCVNILTEPASVVKDMISYLRTNTIYPVNVVGVELGNEVYFDFQELSLGFVDFEHYWDYINGENFGDLEDVLPENVYTDHDYIGTLKGDSEFDEVKIGLPAQNLPSCGEEWDFPLGPPGDNDTTGGQLLFEPVEETPCPCKYPKWNIEMVPYYIETVTAEPGHETRYAFDAIIFHNYYPPTNNSGTCAENSNWQDILLVLNENYDPEYLEDNMSDEEVDPFYFTDAYDYSDPSDPEPDLKDAFYNITGIHNPDDLVPGNYKEFTRDRLSISYDEHANNMMFTDNDEEPENKEVWVTEYNLDDKIALPPGEFRDNNEHNLTFFESAATNTFSHAVMLQHWFLWHLKSAFDPDYRPYYLTRATIQNTLSGSSISLMTPSDEADQVLITEAANCTTGVETPYYVRRAGYYAAQLWGIIGTKHLHYLKSQTAMASLNNNLAPTVFIDDEQNLYVFYTNVSDESQWYGIDPGTLYNDYGGAGWEVHLESEVEGLILDADQLYSTAGKSALFFINEGYLDGSYHPDCDEAITRDNRYELDGLDETDPTVVSCPGPFESGAPGGICLEVPPISMGYFIIPFTVEHPRLGDNFNKFTIYPNPASTHFIIQQINGENKDADRMGIEIFNIYGGLVQTNEQVSEGQAIDITQLPVGVYSVNIKTGGLATETESLVKMK